MVSSCRKLWTLHRESLLNAITYDSWRPWLPTSLQTIGYSWSNARGQKLAVSCTPFFRIVVSYWIHFIKNKFGIQVHLSPYRSGQSVPSYIVNLGPRHGKPESAGGNASNRWAYQAMLIVSKLGWLAGQLTSLLQLQVVPLNNLSAGTYTGFCTWCKQPRR